MGVIIMTMQIENVVDGAIVRNDENTFEKFTTKAVCKSLGCKESSLRKAMKYVKLKVGKDEFGNKWFTKEDIDKVREGMQSRKTDLLLKILSREFERENAYAPSREYQFNGIKAQVGVEQLVEKVKLEMNNVLIAQTELLQEEMRSMNSENLARMSNTEGRLIKCIEEILIKQVGVTKEESNDMNKKNQDQLRLIIESALAKQNEIVKNEFSVMYKSNSDLRIFIENQIKKEIQSSQMEQMRYIKNEIATICEREEDALKNTVEQINTEIQSIVSEQTEIIKNEIITLYKHNEELKKRVEELTRMIQTTQEGHFKAVDERLHQLIESSKKKGLFKSK